jgi:OmcA/MtrC family decaheme c-type cytochrome
VPEQLVNTLVQHTSTELALSGNLQPRRVVVSNEKCNACHAALGSASGSNTLPNAFHSGGRTTVEICAVCHDPNRVSSTVVTSGAQLNESYQFKRMIHGIHGNSKRFFPFTNGNKVVGAFCNPDNTSPEAQAACDPSLTLAPTVTNFAAEVKWPGVGLNCNACHVNNSYLNDQGTLGAVVLKYGDSAAGPAVFGGAVQLANAWDWNVISPKAASCTACHDYPKAVAHVQAYGNGTFGWASQSAWPQETCADCHAQGLFMGVDRVHGLTK